MIAPERRRSGPAPSSIVAAAVVLGAVALIAAAVLAGSTPDDEEFRFAVLSAWLRVHALASGDGGHWTPLLGFGLPQPFSPNFSWHPLALLLLVMTPVAWARLLVMTHTVIGAAGMWRLTKTLHLRRLTRAVCAATFLLASPAQNYVLVEIGRAHV